MAKLKDLPKTQQNPRTINTDRAEMLREGLEEFGSLDGIVYNRARKELVGGNQRSEISPDADIVIVKRFDPPDKFGTVAEGFAVSPSGVRIPYREVHWPERDKHLAATLRANSAAGEWDRAKRAEIILHLDTVNYDLRKTGHTVKEIENIVAPIGPPPEKKTISFEANVKGYDDNAPKTGAHECPRCGYAFN